MESEVELVWVKKVHLSSFPLYAVLLLEFRMTSHQPYRIPTLHIKNSVTELQFHIGLTDQSKSNHLSNTRLRSVLIVTSLLLMLSKLKCPFIAMSTLRP